MFDLSLVPGTSLHLAMQRWEGREPRLVYLHGLALTGSYDWPRVASAAALAGRASLAVDLLGFGKSPRPSDFSYDLTAQAELVAALISQEASNVALIGHSFGGTVAVLLAELLIRRGRPPEAVLLAEPNLRAEEATLSARAAATPLDQFLKQWPAWVEAADLPYYRDGLRQSDALACHRSAVSLVHHSRQLLPRFTALPVARKGYVLGGKSDGVTRETARLVAAAGIPVVTVPGSGHPFCEEDPVGFAKALAQLLD